MIISIGFLVIEVVTWFSGPSAPTVGLNVHRPQLPTADVQKAIWRARRAQPGERKNKCCKEWSNNITVIIVVLIIIMPIAVFVHFFIIVIIFNIIIFFSASLTLQWAFAFTSCCRLPFLPTPTALTLYPHSMPTTLRTPILPPNQPALQSIHTHHPSTLSTPSHTPPSRPPPIHTLRPSIPFSRARTHPSWCTRPGHYNGCNAQSSAVNMPTHDDCRSALVTVPMNFCARFMATFVCMELLYLTTINFLLFRCRGFTWCDQCLEVYERWPLPPYTRRAGHSMADLEPIAGHY